jgi:hypothetical protein
MNSKRVHLSWSRPKTRCSFNILKQKKNNYDDDQFREFELDFFFHTWGWHLRY